MLRLKYPATEFCPTLTIITPTYRQNPGPLFPSRHQNAPAAFRFRDDRLLALLAAAASLATRAPIRAFTAHLYAKGRIHAAQDPEAFEKRVLARPAARRFRHRHGSFASDDAGGFAVRRRRADGRLLLSARHFAENVFEVVFEFEAPRLSAAFAYFGVRNGFAFFQLAFVAKIAKIFAEAVFVARYGGRLVAVGDGTDLHRMRFRFTPASGTFGSDPTPGRRFFRRRHQTLGRGIFLQFPDTRLPHEVGGLPATKKTTGFCKNGRDTILATKFQENCQDI